MKLDLSAAPEVALLTEASGCSDPADASSEPVTVGYLAGCLRRLAGDPDRWWDQVRFDPDRAVRIDLVIPETGCAAWLLVLPPGYQPAARGDERDWEVASVVAGLPAGQVITPDGMAAPAMLPGRIRVRGTRQPYGMINSGGGYSVSLHARACGASATGSAEPGFAQGDVEAA